MPLPEAPANRQAERFVTLFDARFLAMGLALYQSLVAQARPFVLWVVCMDEEVEAALRHLQLEHLRLLPVAELETARLLAVKPTRSSREYCWTLTPFVPAAVLARDPEAERVTYLDADLYFFGAPAVLLDELTTSGKDVLITAHAYAPPYADTEARNGRFCVQFLCFRRSPQAQQVMDWWQERCLEWCYNRYEGDKFGDQKYLDAWPQLFAAQVHVATQTECTLAPWNAAHFYRLGKARPVFFHFQGFRLVSAASAVLCAGYEITPPVQALYDQYLAAIRQTLGLMRNTGIALQLVPRATGAVQYLRDLRNRLSGNTLWARI